MKLSKKAKQVLLVAVIINLAAGAQFSWSLLGRGLMTEYGYTAAQAALPYSLLTFTSGINAIFAGMVGDRKAPRYGVIMGTLWMGVGLILSAYVRQPWIMAITAGFMLGMASSNITSNTMLSVVKWSPTAMKGLVAGIVTLAIGAGTFYMSPLINWLVGSVGISSTFIWLGVGQMCIILPASIFLLVPPKATVADTNAADVIDDVPNGSPWFNFSPTQALKSTALPRCWAMYLCSAVAGLIMISQMANIALAQANYSKGYILVVLLAIGSCTGRLGISTMSDKIGVFSSWKLIFAVQAVNMALFSFYHTAAPIMVGTIIAGICFGGGIPLMMGATPAYIFGKKNMGTIYGFIATGYALAGLTAPYIAGRLFDATGSYGTAFVMASIVCIIGLIVSFTFKPFTKPEEQAA